MNTVPQLGQNTAIMMLCADAMNIVPQLGQNTAIMVLCADAGQQSSQWVYCIPYQQPGVNAYRQPTVLQGQSNCVS